MAGPRKRVLKPKADKASIKAAADRAEKRAKGEPVAKTTAAPIDPPIKPAAEILTEKIAAKTRAQRKRRRSRYSEPLGKAICKMLARGHTLTSICQRPLMPKEDMVLGWAIDPSHPFCLQYARAREVGYRRMGDELLDLADDSARDFVARTTKDGGVEMVLNREALERTKLRIETRKWLLSKALPKVFGDALAIEHAGAISAPAEGAPAKPHQDAVTGITARFARKANNSTVATTAPAVHVNGKAKANGHANGHAKNGSGVH